MSSTFLNEEPSKSESEPANTGTNALSYFKGATPNHGVKRPGQPSKGPNKRPPKTGFSSKLYKISRTTASAISNYQVGTKQFQTHHTLDPISTYFQVYVSDIGIDGITAVLYQHMLARNRKLEITLPQFRYVTCLAFWNRISQAKSFFATGEAYPDTFDLHHQVQHILLPGVIHNYIMAIGEVTTPNGAKIVPYAPRLPEESAGYILPARYWHEGHPGQPAPPNFWTLDTAWITQWNDHVSRGGKHDFGLKELDYTNRSGSLQMLVSLRTSRLQDDTLDTTVYGVSPVNMDKIEAEVGAAYLYRNYLQYDRWPGPNAELLYAVVQTTPFVRRQLLSEQCAAHSRAAPMK